MTHLTERPPSHEHLPRKRILLSTGEKHERVPLRHRAALLLPLAGGYAGAEDSMLSFLEAGWFCPALSFREEAMVAAGLPPYARERAGAVMHPGDWDSLQVDESRENYRRR